MFAQQGRARGPGAHMGPGPYGPWPIWAWPIWPLPIWAMAHMGYVPDSYIHPYPCIRKWVFLGRLCHFLISGGYFPIQGLISYVKFLKYKTRFKYKNLGHSPYGPWPIWAKAHMGQGPYGPRPIWARAHMGPGPLGPGPFLVGRTPHQKTHPGKKSPNCVFDVF